MTWLERLVKESKEIVKHGQGQLILNVGFSGKDKTNILITAGKTHRFVIERFEVEED